MVADEQYFVENILAERTNADGEPEYLVKWAGYPNKEASWEPAENISEDIIAEWEEDHSTPDSHAEQGDEEDVEEVEQEVDDPLPDQNWMDRVGYRYYERRVILLFVPTHLVPATAKEVLDRVGADCIIGHDATRYLMSHKPNPLTGEERTPMWIDHHLVDESKFAEWNELVQRWNQADDYLLETGNDESSQGAWFFRQYDYFRDDGSIFIQEMFQPGRRGLQANLVEAGVLTDHPTQAPAHFLDEEEEDDDDDDDDQMEIGDVGAQASVSRPSQPSREAPISGSSTDNDSIEQGNELEDPIVAPAGGVILWDDASTDADAEWIMQQWKETSIFPTAADIEGVMNVDLGMGDNWMD